MTVVVDFFSPDDGRFLATMQSSDVADIACCGVSYWPAPIPCMAPVITEVLCATSNFACNLRIPSTDSCIAIDP